MQVGTFRSDIVGFGAGYMSGLKPTTYGVPLQKIETSAGQIHHGVFLAIDPS